MKKHCAVIAPLKIPEYVDSIMKKLEARSISSKLYNWDSIDDNELFDVNLNPVIIIAGAEKCPAFMPQMIKYYLSIGGKLVTLGGPPFKTEFYSINNVEVDYSELTSRFSLGDFDKTIIMPFSSSDDLEGFEKNTYNPDSKQYDGFAYLSIENDTSSEEKYLRYYTDNFSINESFEKKISIPKGHNVIGFWAKAFENTRTITISLIEESGNMFKACITPSENFNYFMLSKKDFIFSGNRNGAVYDKKNALLSVELDHVVKIQFGHALSHAYSVAGEHWFLISEISSGRISVLNDGFVSIDGVCPAYKFYPITNAVKAKCSEGQAILSEYDFDLPSDAFSLSPRAGGTGIDKERRFRFIPLIEALDRQDIHCGYLAYMLLNFSYGRLSSESNGSVILAFTTNSEGFYFNGGCDAVVQAISYMLSPVLLLEGGSDEYLYQEDCENAVFGAVILTQKDIPCENYRVKIQINNVSNIFSLEEFTLIKSENGYDFNRVAFSEPPTNGSVIVTLLQGEETIDMLKSELCIYHPKPADERHFAYIKENENEIYIDNRPMRFFGVNYMPSANAGLDTWDEFENYVAKYAYEPEIIMNDLKRICNIGINAVSIFAHYSQSMNSNNLLHLIRLCEDNGLYVNLSLRPNADPFHFNEAEVKDAIKHFRLDENDTIVSYDIAWERYVGTYNECYGNFDGRKIFDKGWREFLLNRYNDYDTVQKLFMCELPQNAEGEIIGLSDDMLRHDGAHTMLAGAYRCYIDSQVAKAHIAACDYIRSIDPNHLITARSGDASTIPLVDPGIYGYDYKALSLALDFMAPESYALTDNYKNMRQGVFTNIYSRYANKNNVIQWMEFGKSIWTGSNFIDNSKMLSFQADYYKNFFEMLMLGHTSGSYAWWYAGGYRIGENSDFGIVNPDGSDRPVTRVFREYAKKFLNAPRLTAADYSIKIDRDKNADGLRSMYLSIEAELFDAMSLGKTVEFIDGGSNKTSADCDLLEVGNVAEHGFSPKYLNSVVTSITAILDNGTKVFLNNGDVLDVQKSKSVTFMFRLTNCEKAKWISSDSYGGVSLQTRKASVYSFSLPIYSDVDFRGFAEFSIALSCEQKGLLSCVLNAKDRTDFGERINIIVK